jgi:hypothetical protein
MDGADFEHYQELTRKDLAQDVDRLKLIADEMLGPDWFLSQNPRLDWRTPLQAVNEGGGEEVKQILQGIAAGVMS